MFRALRLTLIALPIGIAAGLSSAAFLEALDRVTEFRIDHEWLLWLLPAAGLLSGGVYSAIGGSAIRGNRLTMTEIVGMREGVPLRMAPLVLGGTLLTHLFGGSAGREGTALQMSAGLTDGVAKRVGFDTVDRRLMLVAALAGGFGSVFGVPYAGVVFAMEVAPASRADRARALPAAVLASFIGNRVVHAVGVHHAHYPELELDDALDLLGVAAAGVVFGLSAWAFVRGTEFVTARTSGWVPSPAVRAGIGGVAVVAMTLAVGTRDYNGLSLPLISDAVSGVDIIWWAFAAKIVMTALTIGTGFQGGEVTPLFVVGATLGAALAGAVGVPSALLAGVGMMAVFGAASNASLACVVMGVELFGLSAVWPLLVACGVARVFSSRRHIYEPFPTAVSTGR